MCFGGQISMEAASGHRDQDGMKARQADLCELTFVSMGGSELAVLRCNLEETVVGVKRRIAHLCGIPAAEQRLVHAGARLQDYETLQACGISTGASILQCVRVRLSGIARHLEALGSSSDPETAVLASQADLVESVVQAEHALSERVRPQASDLQRAISLRHRGELINWMMQAFAVMRFDDAFLHSVVLTLDRYYALCAAPIEVQTIQRVLLSAVCTEMKLAGQDFPTNSRLQALRQLCHGGVSLEAILQTEFEVLSRLSFVVGVPTPVTFLRELGLRLRETGSEEEQQAGKEAFDQALFLLELAFFEPYEEYARPHAFLAAGALSAALRVLEDKYQGERCGPERRQQLFEDLALYYQDKVSCVEVDTQVLDCEESLLKLWLARAAGWGGCEWGDFYANVEAKFARRGVHLYQHGRGGISVAEGALARCRQERSGEATWHGVV